MQSMIFFGIIFAIIFVPYWLSKFIDWVLRNPCPDTITNDWAAGVWVIIVTSVVVTLLMGLWHLAGYLGGLV
jgi:hypothetical protein